jgi:phosphoglycerate kinase
LLECNVTLAPDCIGEVVSEMATELDPGDILILENLRFHPEEQENDDDFARRLASLCDVYVNDAFAVSHRANASVEAITRHAPISCAGFLLKGEIEYFQRAMENPKRPLIALVGGAKVSGKLAALENMIRHVDRILVGGAMANTFLRSLGHGTGISRVEEDMVDTARKIIRLSEDRGVRFHLPVDVVVSTGLDDEEGASIVTVQEMPEDRMALDIGPATRDLFAEQMKDAGTIVWNGPMGVFEVDAFSQGTLAMVECLGGSGAMTIIGGGDTDTAVHKAGMADSMTYISTGGGAFLTLLEGRELPALAALEKSSTGS